MFPRALSAVVAVASLCSCTFTQSAPIRETTVCELSIPRELELVLMACLEKNPVNRPSSAFELESRLAVIRCEASWTEDRARAWWETHAPEVVAPSTTS